MLGASDAATAERVFITNASQQVTSLNVNGTSCSGVLNVDDMTFLPSYPAADVYILRRVGGDDAFKVSYWDDSRWIPFAKGAAAQIGEALLYNRAATCIYAHQQCYHINLVELVQTNRVSRHKRPLKIPDAPKRVVDTLQPIKGSWQDEENVPSDMVCPISRLPMRQPVVAEDGRSYEQSAISAWLAKKSVSPLTNNPIGSTLIANHNLRAVIIAEMEKQAKAFKKQKKRKTVEAGPSEVGE